MQTLGKVCTFENGDRGENYPGRSAFVSKGIPIINAGHLLAGGIDTSDMNFIARDRFDLLRSGKIGLGDVLFCLRGSLGKFAINDVYQEGAIASSLIIIRPTAKLDTGFLAAYLQSTLCAEMIRKYENGAAQPNLGGKSLELFSIPLPPLDEQRQIVAVLDKAFAGIATATANAQKNLANAKELFESHLQTIFTETRVGWKESAFEDCLQRTKYTSKVQRKDFKEAGAFPIISQEADFINGYWDDPSDVLRVKSPVVIFGDHTRVLKYVNFDFVLGADGVKLLSPQSFLDAKFLLYFLKANPIRSVGYARHYRLLKELKVVYPSLSQQRDIAKRLDEFSEEIERVVDAYDTKVTLLAELKQSLLQKAFAGELT